MQRFAMVFRVCVGMVGAVGLAACGDDGTETGQPFTSASGTTGGPTTMNSTTGGPTTDETTTGEPTTGPMTSASSTDPSTDPSTTMSPGVCGDGNVDGGEECDDGNQDDADACTNACKTGVCGDGITLVGVEECDDGNVAYMVEIGRVSANSSDCVS